MLCMHSSSSHGHNYEAGSIIPLPSHIGGDWGNREGEEHMQRESRSSVPGSLPGLEPTPLNTTFLDSKHT